MRTTRTIVLAGAALLLAAGTAYAASSELHTMKVSLPDGSVAHIAYSGDVAPKVEIAPANARGITAFEPVDAAYPDPFMELDRISAMMEQQADAMFRHAVEMDQATASGTTPAQLVSTGELPAGSTVQYTFYSSSNGNDACTQSIEWRSDGSGSEPKMIRTSTGNCGAAAQDGAARLNAPSPEQQASTTAGKPA